MKYTDGKRRSLALGTIAAMSIGVSACGSGVEQPLKLPETPVQFASVNECIAAGYETIGCHDAYEAAVAKHAAEAPRFKTQAECNAEWGDGNCKVATNNSGGSSFMPFMMGYLVSSALNGPNSGYYQTGRSYGAPIYRNRSGLVQYRKDENQGGGSGVVYAGGRSYGYSTTPVTAAKPSPRSTVSRGGFGSSVGSRGSFGG